MNYQPLRRPTVAIADRSLTPGTTLRATYRKTAYTCTVEANGDGSLGYRLEDGRHFTSPSITHTAQNGWRWWSLTSAAPQAKAAATAKPRATGKAGDKRRSPLLKPLDDQTAAPEGMAQWWCSACMTGFLHPVDALPAACPNGHNNPPTA
jgi:hypothetical protein